MGDLYQLKLQIGLHRQRKCSGILHCWDMPVCPT
nr:unnamed protein product [Callosobruchus analis]